MRAASKYYFTRDGLVYGPVSSSELRAFARVGTLLPTDRVCKEGWAEWIEASQMKGLFPVAENAVRVAPAPQPINSRDYPVARPWTDSAPNEPLPQAAPPGASGFRLPSRSAVFFFLFAALVAFGRFLVDSDRPSRPTLPKNLLSPKIDMQAPLRDPGTQQVVGQGLQATPAGPDGLRPQANEYAEVPPAVRLLYGQLFYAAGYQHGVAEVRQAVQQGIAVTYQSVEAALLREQLTYAVLTTVAAQHPDYRQSVAQYPGLQDACFAQACNGYRAGAYSEIARLNGR